MKLFCANSLTFDFKKEIGRVDYIMSSPPFYQGQRDLTIEEKIKGMNGLLGETTEQHTQVLVNFFKKLIKQLNVSLALVQFDYGYFAYMTKHKEKIIDAPSKVTIVPASNWSALHEQDIFSLMSRYFHYPKGKKFLDPYCGTGRILKVAKFFEMDCYGVDISEEQINLAKKCLNLN